MRIAFDQTEDDLIATGAAMYRHDPVARKQLATRRKAAAVIGLLGAVSAAVPAAGLLDLSPAAAATPGVVLVVFAVMLWPTPGRLDAEAKAFAKRVLSAPTGDCLLGPRSFEVTPAALLVKTRVSESVIRWEAVGYVARNEDHVFINIPGPALFAIPRQAFETDTKFEQFADAAEAAFRAAHPGGPRVE